jgi:hypothetical protein
MRHEPLMKSERTGPFESLESAHESLSLLREALEDAQASIGDDTAIAQREEATRRVDALQLVEIGSAGIRSRASCC